MGFTHNSEDSSEFAFLLVENYTMTAPAGLRPGRESLETHISSNEDPFHCARSFVGCREGELEAGEHGLGQEGSGG